jgi:hypothetical protein
MAYWRLAACKCAIGAQGYCEWLEWWRRCTLTSLPVCDWIFSARCWRQQSILYNPGITTHLFGSVLLFITEHLSAARGRHQVPQKYLGENYFVGILTRTVTPHMRVFLASWHSVNVITLKHMWLRWRYRGYVTVVIKKLEHKNCQWSCSSWIYNKTFCHFNLFFFPTDVDTFVFFLGVETKLCSLGSEIKIEKANNTHTDNIPM